MVYWLGSEVRVGETVSTHINYIIMVVMDVGPHIAPTRRLHDKSMYARAPLIILLTFHGVVIKI